MNLRDQHVLITGGSSGIGLAIALRAALQSARVSLIARDPERLEAARRSILAQVPAARVFTASADVASESELKAALALAESSLGPVEVLVTSAGISRPGYFEEIPVEVFERTVAVNYLGTVYAVKALLPAMKARGHGLVILISSGVGIVGLFGYSAYAPTKFALRGLAEALRAEMRSTGVTISIVYPPDTGTPQLKEENATKPPETKALTARAGLWSAEAVAQAALDGASKGRFAITPGLTLSALFWTHSILAPFLWRSFDRTVARARRKAIR